MGVKIEANQGTMVQLLSFDKRTDNVSAKKPEFSSPLIISPVVIRVKQATDQDHWLKMIQMAEKQAARMEKLRETIRKIFERLCDTMGEINETVRLRYVRQDKLDEVALDLQYIALSVAEDKYKSDTASVSQELVNTSSELNQAVAELNSDRGFLAEFGKAYSDELERLRRECTSDPDSLDFTIYSPMAQLCHEPICISK